MEKTLQQVFDELSATTHSYKFEMVNDQLIISVDGLMHSLRKASLKQ